MSSLLDAFAPILRGGLSFLSKRSLPVIQGNLSLTGLSGPVEILRDRWGVPHIYAGTLNDVIFAQGFVHAQDRLFQMELNRRTATGRLSEVFGPMALDTDRAARTFGYARLGKADFDLLPAETQNLMDAYTAGINAFLTHPSTKLPIEFTLLGYKPEPWTTDDSMAFSRLMFWQLSHAWYSEIVRARLYDKVGAEHASEWEIRYPPQNPSILPAGIEFNRLDGAGKLTGAPQRGQGSNCWVISGERSETGKPYLCNDMHLVLSLPTIWYEAHLNGGPLNVSGVTMPGIPLALVGHNDRISWGITLAFTDCEDLFIEEFNPNNPELVRTPDGWQPVETVEEVILVKGKPEHVEPVLFTRHGPVISDVVGYPQQKVSVCSMALRPTCGLHAWNLLNRAANWQEFETSMQMINATQLNIGYADVDGNIGYYVTGAHPIRGKGDGRMPSPGWDAAYDWQGEVPLDQIPHAINPQKGYVVTCNNKIIPDDYPYDLGQVWMNGFRANRLTQMIEEKPKLGPDDFNKMQMDVTNIPSQEFIDLLVGVNHPDETITQMLAELRAWDRQLTTETVGGAVYEVLRYNLVRGLMEPVLGREMSDRLLGIAFNPILLTDHEFFGYDTVNVIRMLKDPDSWWMMRAGGKDAILRKSLEKTAEYLKNTCGPSISDWQWGKLHQLTFAHALGAQKPLDLVFNRGPFPIGGDTDTPLQSAISPDSPYDNKLWSPSVRFIMDMRDLSKSVVTTPVGQSGQLGSRHYDDFIPDYLNGSYHPMLWTREQIQANLEGRLLLNPTKQEPAAE